MYRKERKGKAEGSWIYNLPKQCHLCLREQGYQSKKQHQDTLSPQLLWWSQGTWSSLAQSSCLFPSLTNSSSLSPVEVKHHMTTYIHENKNINIYIHISLYMCMYVYLNSTVMEDVPEPWESSVLVALVKKPDLFFDDIFGLRTCVLVEVHHKTWVLLIFFCRSSAAAEEGCSCER